ncbi:hypothetical protein Tco_0851535 [Tanacetum coccineum]
MCTFLKNMTGWKPKDLKTKSFANKAKAEVIKGSSKRAGDELEQERIKKQKICDDQEEAEMKKLMEVVPDEKEVAVDAIPLATKPPNIIDWKIVKEGKMSFFQIIKANGSAKRYSSFIQMLKDFDREDLKTLWKLVKAKHGYTRPEEGYARLLWGDLKTMFEPNVEDMAWRNLQGNKVLMWKLFDSCGVHFVRFQSLHVFMLVEKQYPLTPATIIEMLNKKLQADYWNEMCYGRNDNKNAGRNRTQGFNTGNAGHYARECQKPKVYDAMYFREQMLLAIKDEARSNLSNEENDFMLDTPYGEDLEELTAAVMLMDQLQPGDDNAENVPSYDAKAISQLEKKAFKEQEDRYLDDILDLEEKLSSHDRIIYKIGQSIQTIHVLGKKPNKVYDPFLKAGLGYTNPVRLKKAIATQPKMYDGDLIHNNKLVTHSTDLEETLEDAKENQNKIRHKMVKLIMKN